MSGNNQHSSKQKEQTCENNQLNAVKEYELIINARNFHYQEFNKWSRYFGLVVGALFVAYYTVSEKKQEFSILVSILGYIVSMCWYWSNKGYTYWWNHWSKYLICVEKQLKHQYQEFNGVYSRFCNVSKIKGNTEWDEGRYGCIVSGANISTSKTVLLMSFFITVAWGYILASGLCMCSLSKGCRIALCIVISLIGTWLLSLLSFIIESYIDGHEKLEAHELEDINTNIFKYKWNQFEYWFKKNYSRLKTHVFV